MAKDSSIPIVKSFKRQAKSIKGKAKAQVSVEALKKRLTKATASIKTLEGKRDQAMEALKRMPTVREGVYAATFAGLTYAYYKGVFNFMPKFFFQFGDVEEDPIGALVSAEAQLFGGRGPLGLLLFAIGVGPEEPGKKKTAVDMDDYYRMWIKKVDGLIDEWREEGVRLRDVEPGLPGNYQEIGTQLQESKARLYAAWAKFTVSAILIAMGLAGGTMLFLMETSTSEVANIGAKMLDAVTPLT